MPGGKYPLFGDPSAEYAQSAESPPAKPKARRWKPPEKLPGFCRFWKLHPWPIEGADCEKVWRRMKLEEIADEICEALEAQLKWHSYAGERLQYMKRAPSYLRKRRWEDEEPLQNNGRPKSKWRD